MDRVQVDGRLTPNRQNNFLIGKLMQRGNTIWNTLCQDTSFARFIGRIALFFTDQLETTTIPSSGISWFTIRKGGCPFEGESMSFVFGRAGSGQPPFPIGS
jgi:hypothetical protein